MPFRRLAPHLLLRRTGRWALLLTAVLACSAAAQPATVHRPVEIELISARVYAHPIRDVHVEAVFTGPNGERVRVAGFWDGGRIFRIRFAPPRTGLWRYRTVCSDPADDGLHDRRGTITARPPDADAHAFLRKGRPRVQPGDRHLSYADGDPLFLLGDTAWEMVWKSRLQDVLPYLSDRRRKGFNAIFLVAMSHQRLEPWGVRNRSGEPFFLDEDYSTPNPRYFDYLDAVVQAANDSGLVVALVPLWAQMSELHHVPEHQRFTVSVEDALLLAHYIGARYAGHNVIWFVGGDNTYDTPARRRFWSTFARVIDEATGGRQLMTVHPGGCQASFDDFGRADWVDFHLFQSSHIAYGPCVAKQARRGYDRHGDKPVMNGEGNYEDLFSRFWLARADTLYDGAERLTAEHVRQSAYESLFSGALAGIGYGANGIWQWTTDEIPGAFWPRYTHAEARDLPGSAQMGLLRRLLEHYGWPRLTPRPDLILAHDGDHRAFAAAGDRAALAYVPAGTRRILLAVPRFDAPAAYRWISPADGRRTPSKPAPGLALTLAPPDASDWLLIVGPHPPPAGTTLPTQASLPVDRNPLLRAGAPWPNPSRGAASLDVDVADAGVLRLDVWDALGRRRHTVETRLPAGRHVVALRADTPGLHLYTLRFTATDGATARATGTFVNPGL